MQDRGHIPEPNAELVCQEGRRHADPDSEPSRTTARNSDWGTFGAITIMDDRMVNELHAVIEQLGGEPVIPCGPRQICKTPFERAQTVVKEVMQAAGITLKELATSLELSARSLATAEAPGATGSI